MSEIKIYDDLIGQNQFKVIQESFMGTRMPWIYQDFIVCDEDLTCDQKHNQQFYIVVYDNYGPTSEAFELMQPIIMHKDLNIQSLVKIKANCNVRTEEVVSHGMHCDVPFTCTTAVYFINDNDGYTTFEDGTRVESVANRMVTFPSTMKHSGSTCTDQKRRVVINFNYFAAPFNETPEYLDKYYGIERKSAIETPPPNQRRLIY